MKRILAAVSILAIAGATALTSANAQGVGVQIGPFGAGIGPYWDGYHHRYWHDYGYAGECRVIRERMITPSGNVVFRSHRVCD